MPSIIQAAFALESIANTPAIIGLMFYPRTTLSAFLDNPLPSTELNPTTVLLARIAGILILALTPQLVLSIPDSKGVAEKRKFAYLSLGVGEAALIPLLLMEASKATGTDRLLTGGGFSRGAALSSVASLLPLLMWRVYVWVQKPHWFNESGPLGEPGKKQT